MGQRVVVCGAGAIGAAIAYHLALRGVAATLVERCGAAAAASGKAGGFLALDWCDGSPLGPLARASFAMHEQLARDLGADVGYRRIDTSMVDAGRHPSRAANADWLDGACRRRAPIGTPETTAQVHPERFTRALVDAACARGARLVSGRVEDVTRGADGAVTGVKVDGEIIAADTVVVALGPWSARACPSLHLPAVDGLMGHSLTLFPSRPVPAEALFVEYADEEGLRDSPEVYPRPDGEVYVCGMSGGSAVPDDASAVEADPAAIAALRRMAGRLSSALAGLEPRRVQACYRPVAADGLPLLGPVAGAPGAYVATGHSCWGILNAPASGLAMAELIADGTARSVDLAPFDPARLGRGSPATS